jgi:hypothetical protein
MNEIRNHYSNLNYSQVRKGEDAAHQKIKEPVRAAMNRKKPAK